MLYEQIAQLRGRIATPVKAMAGDAGGGEGGGGSGDAGLSTHLSSMLAMRGSELEESKRRLQSYKERTRELQASLTQGDVELATAQREAQRCSEARVSLEDRVRELEEDLREAQARVESPSGKALLEKEKEATAGLEAMLQTIRAELEESKAAVQAAEQEVVPAGAVGPHAQSHVHVYDTNEHVEYLEEELVKAKIGWAQAEEDKDTAEFRSKELKHALSKGREINMQFAKRMTKLEVKLNKEKEKRSAGGGGFWGGSGP